MKYNCSHRYKPIPLVVYSIIGLFFIAMIGFLSMYSKVDASTARSSTIVKGILCSTEVKNFKPKWAPSDGWKIQCVNGNLEKKNSDDKYLLGLTFSGEQFIFIRNDINDKEALDDIIVHEWTHAAITYYGLHGGKNWKKWVSLIHDTPGHTIGYYGDPDEVLAENTARCTLGYYYTSMGFDRMPCKTIHKLFPVLSTVQDRYDFLKDEE